VRSALPVSSRLHRIGLLIIASPVQDRGGSFWLRSLAAVGAGDRVVTECQQSLHNVMSG